MSHETAACLAYVGVGSNLLEPEQQVLTALDALGHATGITLLRVSSAYKSAPMGPADQPDFINVAAEIEVSLTPLELLDVLQSIEQAQGRDRSVGHWGPRTIDLDLLLYGDRYVQNERLQVPHAGIADRNFVLLPLNELSPQIFVPGRGTVAELLVALPDQTGRIEKLG